MEKMEFKSKDIVSDNVKKISNLFPNVVSEGKIDFEKLRQELTYDLIEGDESYDFTWVGKKNSVIEANTPTTKTLRPCVNESVNFDTTENLYIEGDNLEVLKILQKSYFGKIKCIYIDPPYNTGNDFIYNDDFKMESDEYKDKSGEVDDEGNRLFKNTDSNGRFHSDWCSMIYSRLKLAYNLLSDDGVIFISIDDNEEKNLKELLNEVFSENNFIANIVRNTNSTKNQSLFVSVSHEYCFVYAKNIENLKVKHQNNKWEVSKNNYEEYVNKVKELQKKGMSNEDITEELKQLTKYPRFIDFTNYWYFDERGLYGKWDLGGVQNGNKTPIYNPLTKKEDPVPPGGFRYSKEKMEELIKDNRIVFHTDGSLPRLKRYLDDNKKSRPKSIMSDDQRPDYLWLQKNGIYFDNPKQLTFMYRILSIFDNDSTIIDFFSGSATTAHAVMKLNAEDGGKRKFIMVQLPEETSKEREAYKAGFKNICEIGKERIRRAGKKIIEENKDKESIKNLDIGFRVLKLSDSNMKNVYYNPDDYSQDLISQLASNIKDDRNEDDLLFASLLDRGIDISKSYRKVDIDGKKVIIYNEEGEVPEFIACFDENITEKCVTEIAKMKPLKATFRDSSFGSSSDRINVEEIFKLYSKDTRVSVM